MEIKLEKRPFWGIDKYLHYLILVFSLLNLFQKFPRLGYSTSLNLYTSIFISLLGLLYFFLEFKNKKGGFFIALLWVLPQVIIYKKSDVILDLSQGYILPIEFSKQSFNSYFMIGFNMVALFVIAILVFKLKNKYRELTITPSGIENLSPFIGEIIKIFSFGLEKKLLVLSAQNDTKTFVIQIDESDNLKNIPPDKKYLLFEMDTAKINELTFKAYELKQVGNVMIK